VSKSRAGSTLVELLVVLTIIALLLGVVGPQLHRSPAEVSSPADATAIEDALRTAAVRAALAQSGVRTTETGVVLVLAEPTGLLLSDSAGTLLLGPSPRMR
jgi:type II secretory pathway pseudopilin PulG